MESKYLPLIFAMRHLRVRFSDSVSENISENACVVQGERKIPLATDAQLEAFLQSGEY